ncbi:ATPase, AAA family [Trichuris suis]|nr:ATPase, AAA family [Trichuris suis]
MIPSLAAEATDLPTLERIGMHSHIRGLGMKSDFEPDSDNKGMVGQLAARKAAAVVVKMIKEGILAGRAILLAGPPGSGKTAIAMGMCQDLGKDTPMTILSGSEIYSVDVSKSELLAQAIRKSIGIRIKEESEVVQGEVIFLDITRSLTAAGGKTGKLTLKTMDMEAVYDIGAKLIDELVKQKVVAGDVIQIDKAANKITKLGVSSTRSVDFQALGPDVKVVSCPSGELQQRHENVHTLTLHDLDIINSRKQGVVALFTGDTGEVSSEVRDQINAKMKEWREEGKASIIPGVLFIDEVHMLDVESFSYLNRALESEFSPVVVMATNRTVSKVRGTNIESPYGIPADFLDRLIIIKSQPYSSEDIFHIIKIRCKEEDVNIGDQAAHALTQLGMDCSLRYAMQLICVANVLAKRRKAAEVEMEDVRMAYELFWDETRSAAYLDEERSKEKNDVTPMEATKMEDEVNGVFNLWKQLHDKKLQQVVTSPPVHERTDSDEVECRAPCRESERKEETSTSSKQLDSLHGEREQNFEVRRSNNIGDKLVRPLDGFQCASELTGSSGSSRGSKHGDVSDERKNATSTSDSQVFKPFSYAWKQKCPSEVSGSNEVVDRGTEKARMTADDAVGNKKLAYRNASRSIPSFSMYSCCKRPLGLVCRDFKPPVKSASDSKYPEREKVFPSRGDEQSPKEWGVSATSSESVVNGVDKELVQMIENEIVQLASFSWDDVAGLTEVKSAIKEIVVWPMLRPDIFTGLRAPSKGVLLFGPPGTGKTLIGSCIASQCKATFFSVSASSLTSKWVGEGEKLVRTLFAVARARSPSVIFIDEVDSLLTKRSDCDNDSMRRMKNEFFSQMEGVGVSKEERLLVIGATNRPWELDEAARRRFTRRLYIPLPNLQARADIIRRLLTGHTNSLSDDAVNSIAQQCEGYSGADVAEVCREAALFPIRRIAEVESIDVEQVPPISEDDFKSALLRIRATVCLSGIDEYEKWNSQYGFTHSAQT